MGVRVRLIPINNKKVRNPKKNIFLKCFIRGFYFVLIVIPIGMLKLNGAQYL